METKTITCINCPLGCQVTATIEEGKIVSVTGNTCIRGERYARSELTHPVRIVTSSVPVAGSATEQMVSVKTASAVPKEKIFDVMEALTNVKAQVPIHIGDVVVHDIAGTGVDMVATRNA